MSDLDAVFGNFITTKKQNIRTAQKKVHVSRTVNINNFGRMINSTFSRQNMKPSSPEKLVERIVTNCEVLNHGKYFEAVDDDGNIHSCVFQVQTFLAI